VVFLGRYSEDAGLVPHITCISYFTIIIRSYATISEVYSDYGTGWKRLELWFDSEQAGDILPSSKAFRADVRLTQPPVQWASGTIYPGEGGVKCPMREAGLSLPFNFVIKSEWNRTSTFPYTVFEETLVDISNE
jgi:hypothetical protein